jgi:DNA-binding GntR family transcriptional regulator
MAQVDMEFHELIMKKSDNSRLLKAWKTIASQMQVLLNSIDFYSLSSNYAQKNHLQILQILRHPEAGDVAQMIKDHILTSRTLIFEQVK